MPSLSHPPLSNQQLRQDRLAVATNLAACENLTYPRLMEAWGVTIRVAYQQVGVLRKDGLWPWTGPSRKVAKKKTRKRPPRTELPPLDPDNLDEIDTKILEVAESLTRDDGTVCSEEVRRAMRIGSRRINRLKRSGLWDWDSPDRWKGGRVSEAEVEAEKAKIKAESLRPMIDGSGELDDPLPGTPPRSGRDHEAWNRRRFLNVAACSEGYAVYRAYGPAKAIADEVTYDLPVASR